MMNLRGLTKIVVVLTGALLIAYDIVPFVNPGRGDTISEVIRDWALKCMALPFVFGVLAGHFFIPRNTGEVRPRILLGLLLVVLGLDVLSYTYTLPELLFIRAHPIISFALGVPVGPLFWRQLRNDCKD